MPEKGFLVGTPGRRRTRRVLTSMISQQQDYTKKNVISTNKKRMKKHSEHSSPLSDSLLRGLSSLEMCSHNLERKVEKFQHCPLQYPKESDGLLKFLEEEQLHKLLKFGASLRESQQLQSPTSREDKEFNARLEPIENRLHEVQRSLQVLQNKKKFDAHENTSDGSVSEAIKNINSTDAKNELLAVPVAQQAFMWLLSDQDQPHEEIPLHQVLPSALDVPPQNQLPTQPPLHWQNPRLQPELQPMQQGYPLSSQQGSMEELSSVIPLHKYVGFLVGTPRRRRTRRVLTSMISQQQDYTKKNVISTNKKRMKKHSENSSPLSDSLLRGLSSLEMCSHNLERKVEKFQHCPLQYQKESDGLLKFLEEEQLHKLLKFGASLRESQQLQSPTPREENEFNARLVPIENRLHEIHRSIEVFQYKQKLADAQNTLTKLQFAQQNPSDGCASEAKKKSNSTIAETQLLAAREAFLWLNQDQDHSLPEVVPYAFDVPPQNQLPSQQPASAESRIAT